MERWGVSQACVSYFLKQFLLVTIVQYLLQATRGGVSNVWPGTATDRVMSSLAYRTTTCPCWHRAPMLSSTRDAPCCAANPAISLVPHREKHAAILGSFASVCSKTATRAASIALCAHARMHARTTLHGSVGGAGVRGRWPRVPPAPCSGSKWS